MAFQKMDRDDSGTVSLAEFKKAMAPRRMTPAQVERAFRRLDTNNDGELSYTEFVQFANQQFSSSTPKAQLTLSPGAQTYQLCRQSTRVRLPDFGDATSRDFITRKVPFSGLLSSSAELYFRPRFFGVTRLAAGRLVRSASRKTLFGAWGVARLRVVFGGAVCTKCRTPSSLTRSGSSRKER